MSELQSELYRSFASKNVYANFSETDVDEQSRINFINSFAYHVESTGPLASILHLGDLLGS